MIYKLGFTLIELVSVISIVCLLLLFAVPIAQPLYQKNQLKIINNKLRSAIQYGRNMALAKGECLTLCPLDNLDWSNGIVLFIDNKNHIPTQSGIIQVWQWSPANIQVNWQGFQSKKYILFSPTLKNATCNGHFYLLVNGKEQDKLIVNRLCSVRSS